MNPDAHDAASLRAYHRIEVPAAHGVANARAPAPLCAALSGEVDGVLLLSPEMRAAAATPETDRLLTLIESGTAAPHLRFGLGFQLTSTSRPGVLPASFGYTGVGGRLALADPDLGLGFGYVRNSTRDIGPGGDARWATLLSALGPASEHSMAGAGVSWLLLSRGWDMA